jgi:hypothetical protein
LKPPRRLSTHCSDLLIGKIVERAHTSNVTIRHLLTRIDYNALITFDYGVPDDGNGPQVFQLRLHMTESGLSCDKLSSGRRYVAYVNGIVEEKKRTNIKYGLGFPRVNDVRKAQGIGMSSGKFILPRRESLITKSRTQAPQLITSVTGRGRYNGSLQIPKHPKYTLQSIRQC